MVKTFSCPKCSSKISIQDPKDGLGIKCPICATSVKITLHDDADWDYYRLEIIPPLANPVILQ